MSSHEYAELKNILAEWEKQYKTVIKDYFPPDLFSNWALVYVVPPGGPPKLDSLHFHSDTAKIRFLCQDCCHGWTSMQGKVCFWFTAIEGSNPHGGLIYFQLNGQKCTKCPTQTFENPMWYAEEIKKVLCQLLSLIAYKFYNGPPPQKRPPLRTGKPRSPHIANLCQACQSGVCDKSKLKSITAIVPQTFTAVRCPQLHQSTFESIFHRQHEQLQPNIFVNPNYTFPANFLQSTLLMNIPPPQQHSLHLANQFPAGSDSVSSTVATSHNCHAIAIGSIPSQNSGQFIQTHNATNKLPLCIGTITPCPLDGAPSQMSALNAVCSYNYPGGLGLAQNPYGGTHIMNQFLQHPFSIMQPNSTTTSPTIW